MRTLTRKEQARVELLETILDEIKAEQERMEMTGFEEHDKAFCEGMAHGVAVAKLLVYRIMRLADIDSINESRGYHNLPVI